MQTAVVQEEEGARSRGVMGADFSTPLPRFDRDNERTNAGQRRARRDNEGTGQMDIPLGMSFVPSRVPMSFLLPFHPGGLGRMRHVTRRAGSARHPTACR